MLTLGALLAPIFLVSVSVVPALMMYYGLTSRNIHEATQSIAGSLLLAGFLLAITPALGLGEVWASAPLIGVATGILSSVTALRVRRKRKARRVKVS